MNRKEIILRWILVITALVTLLTYSKTFHLGFLSYGDKDLVLENQGVIHFNLARMLFHAYQGHYLPMAFLSYAVENAFFGLQAFHFHLDNVLLHIANTLLVLLLIYRLSEGNFLVAAMGGLLFGIHPGQIETVTWVSGRSELLCAFFLLISSHFYLRYINHRKNLFGGTYLFCLFFFILALLSNSAAVVFPAEREFSWNSFLEKIPFLATASVLISFVIIMNHVPLLAKFEPLLIFKDWAAMWWPQESFPFQRTFVGSLSGGAWAAGSVAALVLIVISMYRIKSRRQILFGVGFFFLMILPDLNFSPLGEDVQAGQSFYLAILGLLYAGACILSAEVVQIPQNRKLWRPVGIAMVVVLAVSFSTLSVFSLNFWNSDKNFWQNVLDHTPLSALAFYHWALEKCSSGDYEASQALFGRAIALTPHSWRVYSSMGNCNRDRGNIPDALAAYDQALRESPDNPSVLLNRGVAHSRSGNLALAIQDVKKALETENDDSEVYFQLGSLLQRSGAMDDAEAAFQQGLEMDPSNAEAHHNLGNVFLDKSQLDQAALQFKLALETDEKLPQTHFSLANVYAALGLGDRALDEYNRSIELNPNFESAHANLGLLLLRTGKLHEAETEYKKALELNPKLLLAHRGLAEVYEKDGRADDAEKEKSLSVER